MVPVVSGREDPEKVHAVKVSGAEQPKDTVIVYSVGTELEASALVTSVHDNCKQSAGPECFASVAGDLHSCHGTCQDHMDCLGHIDQLAHVNAVENGLETGTVSPLTHGSIKADPCADIKEPHSAG